MARIAGVNIPTNKRVVIALQYIHGIGQAKAREIVAKVGIDDARRVAREALTLDDQLSLDPLAQFSERERARMTALAQ